MKEAAQAKRSAWWLWVIAAAFLLNFGVILRNDWAGPSLGLQAFYEHGGMVVHDIYAPSANVPLQQGDHIVRVDKHTIASAADWWVVLMNLQVNKRLTFEIRRNNESRQVSVTPEGRRYVGYYSPGVIVQVRIAQLIALAVACLVGFARPRNRSALLTALFFFGVSTLNVADTMSGISATYVIRRRWFPC